MPNITLIPGDYDLNDKGYHICDERGYAIIVTEEKEVTITEQSDYERIDPITRAHRVFRGLSPDGYVLVVEDSVIETEG